MIKEPRLLLFKDKLYIMAVTYNLGVIIDLEGPYQLVGAPQQSKVEFFAKFQDLMLKAVNNPELKVDDIPAELQAKLFSQHSPES